MMNIEFNSFLPIVGTNHQSVIDEAQKIRKSNQVREKTVLSDKRDCWTPWQLRNLDINQQQVARIKERIDNATLMPESERIADALLALL